MVKLEDPSQMMRSEPVFADKPVGQFRDYTIDEKDPIKERVRMTYKLMHTYQTVDFVKGNDRLQKYFEEFTCSCFSFTRCNCSFKTWLGLSSSNLHYLRFIPIF